MTAAIEAKVRELVSALVAQTERQVADAFAARREGGFGA